MNLVKLLLLACFLAINLNATVRYVSKTGSSTPPYTSWATAADSIQKAIDFSVFGDTIYVANGVYAEQLLVKSGLSLIGSSMDSCIIDTRNIFDPLVGGTSIELMDSTLFKGFNLKVTYPYYGNSYKGWGIYLHGGPGEGYTGLIEYNRISGAEQCMRLADYNGKIRHNVITTSEKGIVVDGWDEKYYPVVDTNYCSVSVIGIQIFYGTSPKITGNITLGGDGIVGSQSTSSDSVIITNNLILGDGFRGINNAAVVSENYNNVISGSFSAGIRTLNLNEIKNNVVMNCGRGIFVETGQTPIVKYNNLWNNATNYQNHIPDSTNLSVDPMFLDEDNLDFHLQMFSPLIDAGDPNILDKDGSRSDIGLFGGPYGESYVYIDLPPSPPRNLTAALDSSTVLLKWLSNTEADFYKYNIYRDTTANFTVDSSKLIASLKDTVYNDNISGFSTNLYYKITALDNQKLESLPSEEVFVVLVGVKEPSIKVRDYILYQNYPNPFNPETTIGYRLKEEGYVRLNVYDIKGELIEELVNEHKNAGYYEVRFNGKGKNRLTGIASGIYLYKIEVLNKEKKLSFIEMKKMVYLK